MKALRWIAVCCLSLPVPAAPAAVPLERELVISLGVDATQDWRNEQQWSKASTTQRYEIVTRLHSDGQRYTDNLLDADLAQRTRIKTEYYTYRGLLELRRENGGRIPSFDQVGHQIRGEAPSALQAHSRCIDAADCPNSVAERFAAITALQHNTPQELEDFVASYDDPSARFLYFSGFEGCPNRIRLQHRSQWSGLQAWDRDKKQLKPFTMQAIGETGGSVAEQQKLCERYVATVDTASGEIYLENAFIPSPRGSIVRSVDGVAERREADLPLPYEVMRWVGDLLRKSADQGHRTTTLHLSQPLDGNATVLGVFDGEAKVDLSWSFTDAAGKPVAK